MQGNQRCVALSAKQGTREMSQGTREMSSVCYVGGSCSTLAYKYIVALRALTNDLDVGAAPTKPTPLYTDAQAIIDGTGCERLKKSSRWMGTRYAMIRWGLACRTIRLAKVPAVDNCADIVTKCLVGEAFFRHRATILGLPHVPS